MAARQRHRLPGQGKGRVIGFVIDAETGKPPEGAISDEGVWGSLVENLSRGTASLPTERRKKKAGGPPVRDEVEQVVLRIAHENPPWGYDRIQGAVANLGHQISDQTVGNVLKRHGMEPAPHRKRQTTWKTLIKSHWDVLGAIDFTTIEVWTTGGLITYYMLFAMELANKIIQPGDEVASHDGEILCRERLGGLLRYYHRDAA